MNKKTISFAFAMLFLLLSVLPVAGMLVLGESGAAANETLSSPPALTGSDGRLNPAVLSETTDYIADHFASRNKLVNAWAELNTTVFHTSPEEQVVLGSEGWLYYSSTLDDYMGRGMNETELNRAVQNLALIQEYAESCGAEFLFTIAPNKNSLYPAHMPSFIPPAHDKSNSVRIKPLLASSGVHYCDLFSLIGGRGEVLYYQTDSHWTDRGAALAADALLKGFGMNTAYYAGDFSLPYQHKGDLYEMLFPAGERTEAAQAYSGFAYSVQENPNGGNAMRIDASQDTADGRLVCWRDSFGIALYPYLADSFSESHFFRSSSYDLTEIGSRQADHVLIELVERNLDWLIRYVPIMPAPSREIDLDSAVPANQTVLANSKADSKHELVYLSGELPCYEGGAVYLLSAHAAYEALLTENDGKWFYHAYLSPEQSEGIHALCVKLDSAYIRFELHLN